VVVGEAEILVQIPPDMTYFGPPDLDELVLTVDGEPRRLVRADPLGRGEARVLVVLDHDLSRDESLSRTAVALAHHAADLVALGPVTVVEIGDGAGPRVRAEATREIRVIENVLTDAAARLRREGQWLAGPPRYAGPPETVWADLADTAREAARGGPQFLLLASDGFFPTDAEMASWNRDAGLDALGDTPPGAPPRGAAVRRAALHLAAAGWVVVPLTLRTEELRHGSSAPAEIQYPDGTGQPFLDFVRIFSYLRGRGAADYERGHEDPRTAEAAWLPELAPLQELASETSGVVVRYEDQLAGAFASLRNRWRLWYEAEALPDHPVPVELTRADRGNEVRARKWLAATP
jgi:hypothetical protein